jgi:hypothetical protein|tara:strand:+ start:406 stop:552 length:147 start_codon:yes stop_codon:yes gene_type:complete
MDDGLKPQKPSTGAISSCALLSDIDEDAALVDMLFAIIRQAAHKLSCH